MIPPPDYVERVYAGVLGKLIGVYLGRPFEGWSHDRIVQTFGEIKGYVHERLNLPLVVTDDDVAGTFTFIRALEDHGLTFDLSSAQIGQTWLNAIIEGRSILWWGGNGVSTEHTAWLNLKRGLPAPLSGAIEINGRALAEQIGAQIFIDGWGLVSPGQPERAARFAREAGRVSHDGESVHAAMLWAAMEAQAFVTSDMEKLFETGLSVIPTESEIAKLVRAVRTWCEGDKDWRETRARIAREHGYDAYPGLCHVMPNHALMVMALHYAPDDFQEAQTIINTAGWDTDCNAGNLGCLMGVKLGLEGLPSDLRDPLADRMLVSNAEGGEAVTDALRTAYRLAGYGQGLSKIAQTPPPKNDARFHFSLPGSVQGFRGQTGDLLTNVAFEGGRALSIDLVAPLTRATTPVFAPQDVAAMPVYDLVASPLIYPGQTLRARMAAALSNSLAVSARLVIGLYEQDDRLTYLQGAVVDLAPGQSAELAWILPELEGRPIAEVGVEIEGEGGRVILDWMTWEGCPRFTLNPKTQGGEFWRRAWVNSATLLATRPKGVFRVSQTQGEGLVLQGTRDWIDYSVTADLKVHLAAYAGVVARARGLRRYYAARIIREGELQIVKAWDGAVEILAACSAPQILDQTVTLSLSVRGCALRATAGDLELLATDRSQNPLISGAGGLIIADGALSLEAFHVGAAI